MRESDKDQTIVFDHIDTVLEKTEMEAREVHACLLAIGGELNGSLFDLGPGVTTIGRSPNNTYAMDFEGVSRHHSQIRMVDETGEAFLKDLGSTNGTFLNNQEVKNELPLKKGDVIKIGVLALQYLPKGDPERLTYEKLHREANCDGLTQCYNKAYFNREADRAVSRHKLTKEPLSIIVFDIDHFKRVNDTYGHDGGDYIIKEMAAVIQEHGVRDGDILARYGGEEFVVMLPRTDLEYAFRIAERIRALVEKHTFTYEEKDIAVTVSVGVADLRRGVKTGTDLFKLADQGVYFSKEAGRNRVSKL